MDCAITHCSFSDPLIPSLLHSTSHCCGNVFDTLTAKVFCSYLLCHFESFHVFLELAELITFTLHFQELQHCPRFARCLPGEFVSRICSATPSMTQEHAKRPHFDVTGLEIVTPPYISFKSSFSLTCRPATPASLHTHRPATLGDTTTSSTTPHRIFKTTTYSRTRWPRVDARRGLHAERPGSWSKPLLQLKQSKYKQRKYSRVQHGFRWVKSHV
jgi:hypothetical protein